MKRSAALALVFLALCALPARAEKGSRPVPANDGPPPPPVIVAQFLGFSTDQAAQFQQMLQDLQTTIQGLQQQMQGKQQEMEKLASADSPDPAAVGKAFLDLRALQRQAGQAIDGYHQRFGALLTPEQMEKVQKVAQAGQLLPAVQAFAAVHLLPPPSPVPQP